VPAITCFSLLQLSCGGGDDTQEAAFLLVHLSFFFLGELCAQIWEGEGERKGEEGRGRERKGEGVRT